MRVLAGQIEAYVDHRSRASCARCASSATSACPSPTCSGACNRFDVPSRAIEEFDFYSVVRASEPEIAGFATGIVKFYVVGEPYNGRRKYNYRALNMGDSDPVGPIPVCAIDDG